MANYDSKEPTCRFESGSIPRIDEQFLSLIHQDLENAVLLRSFLSVFLHSPL